MTRYRVVMDSMPEVGYFTGDEPPVLAEYHLEPLSETHDLLPTSIGDLRPIAPLPARVGAPPWWWFASDAAWQKLGWPNALDL